MRLPSQQLSWPGFRYTLQASTFQMAILLQYNTQDSYTVQQLTDSKQIQTMSTHTHPHPHTHTHGLLGKLCFGPRHMLGTHCLCREV